MRFITLHNVLLAMLLYCGMPPGLNAQDEATARVTNYFQDLYPSGGMPSELNTPEMDRDFICKFFSYPDPSGGRGARSNESDVVDDLICDIPDDQSGGRSSGFSAPDVNTVPVQGFHPNYNQLSGSVDNIDIISGKLNVTIPLGSLPRGPGGIGYTLKLNE